jgi:sodium transport system ATP-binding protein
VTPLKGIWVDNLRKEYRRPDGTRFAAVDNVSFKAESGKIFGLLGPNGAGKTTTLRILATLIPPTSGSASIAGYDVEDDAAEVRRQIGFLTGSTGLYPRLTAREAVAYFGALQGLTRDQVDASIDSIFDELDITPYQHKRCGELSTGMKQKVSIARAIIQDPPVIVLDEPTTGLDVLASRTLVDFILRSKERGRCVLFSTHIMSEAERLCDDIAIIHEGRIVGRGTVEALRAETGKDKVEDVFLEILSRAGTGTPS